MGDAAMRYGPSNEGGDRTAGARSLYCVGGRRRVRVFHICNGAITQ